MRQRNLKVVLGILFVVLAIAAVVFYVFQKKTNPGALPGFPMEKALFGNYPMPEPSVLLSYDEGIKKINITTGEVQAANQLEQEDFSDYAGLPTIGANGSQDTQLSKVLVSQDAKKALAVFSVYASSSDEQGDDPANLQSTSVFSCDISKKKCEPSEILSQKYDSLDGELQKKNSFDLWTKWDSGKNMLYASQPGSGDTDMAPVYQCDVKNKSCVSTSEVSAAVPSGAFSPALDKFVMVAQHDQPGLETGKQWELELYSTSDLSKPAKNYDLSFMIDSDPGVAYDGVHSVAWSWDEKTLAIGTTRRIFLFNLDAGSASIAYVAPSDEEGGSYWDSSALYLSPDGKYVAFVDDAASTDDQAEGEVSLNNLNVMDTAKNNLMRGVVQENGLSLKL